MLAYKLLHAFTHAFILQNRNSEYKKYKYTQNTTLPQLRIVLLGGEKRLLIQNDLYLCKDQLGDRFCQSALPKSSAGPELNIYS